MKKIPEKNEKEIKKEVEKEVEREVKREIKKKFREMSDQEKRELIKKHVSEFRKQFKNQMAIFITGAFSFVAALLWNNAITQMIARYQGRISSLLPFKEQYVVSLIVALVISIFAVLAIIIITKLLKEE